MELSINGVSFSYETKDVLHDVTFEAHRGEVLGILGENGCGKTTLLKCINSLLRPTAGNIEICDIDESILREKTAKRVEDGRLDVSDLNSKDLARCMAVVSQSAQVNFPFTVLETVMMGRYAHNTSINAVTEEERTLIYNSLRDAGALPLTSRHVNELSGGELRRVMIARALVQNTDVLLLDEPTLHLDVCHQIDLMELISDLARERNILVLLVTHDMMLAARYCDKIILMEHGRIVACGPTEDVLTERNLAEIFHVRCRITRDDDIRGMNVVIIGKLQAAGGEGQGSRRGDSGIARWHVQENTTHDVNLGVVYGVRCGIVRLWDALASWMEILGGGLLFSVRERIGRDVSDRIGGIDFPSISGRGAVCPLDKKVQKK